MFNIHVLLQIFAGTRFLQQIIKILFITCFTSFFFSNFIFIYCHVRWMRRLMVSRVKDSNPLGTQKSVSIWISMKNMLLMAARKLENFITYMARILPIPRKTEHNQSVNKLPPIAKMFRGKVAFVIFHYLIMQSNQAILFLILYFFF